jgi:hypothetical protein
MAQATLLSSASTHSVFTGTGTYYGITASRGAGGTVVVADLLDAGATALDLNDPSGISGALLALGPAAAAVPADFVGGAGVQITNGLTVSYTSTTNVTVHFDE